MVTGPFDRSDSDFATSSGVIHPQNRTPYSEKLRSEHSKNLKLNVNSMKFQNPLIGLKFTHDPLNLEFFDPTKKRNPFLEQEL